MQTTDYRLHTDMLRQGPDFVLSHHHHRPRVEDASTTPDVERYWSLIGYQDALTGMDMYGNLSSTGRGVGVRGSRGSRGLGGQGIRREGISNDPATWRWSQGPGE